MAGFPYDSIEEPIVKRLIQGVLVIGVGGGGDVVGAIHIYLWMKRLGANTLLASIPWERFSIDPVPGPIGIDEVVGGKIIGNYAMLVNGNEYVIRNKRRIIPQGVRVAKVLKTKVALIDASHGEKGLRKGIEELCTSMGLDTTIGIDVGGDIVAKGHEDNLWSPLMDALALAAIANSSVYGLIGIHSIGADGELDINITLSRISEVIKHGGLVGIYGLCRTDITVLSEILEHAETEASSIAYLAAKGFIGFKDIRLSTRKVNITPYSMVTFLVDARILYQLSPLAQVLTGTEDIREARERLNNIHVYTELDLEEDLYPLLKAGRKLTKEVILEIYRKGVKRVKDKSTSIH